MVEGWTFVQELCARSIYSICITQTLIANSSSSLQCSKVSSSDVAVMSIVNSIRAVLRETTKDVQRTILLWWSWWSISQCSKIGKKVHLPWMLSDFFFRTKWHCGVKNFFFKIVSFEVIRATTHLLFHNLSFFRALWTHLWSLKKAKIKNRFSSHLLHTLEHF